MTYGSDSGWRISDDDTPEAKQFLACVKEVEYYDGSKWVNPYYDYWVEEYKENLYTNLLIKKILDLGVDREILIQRDSIVVEIKPEDIIIDENAKIVIKQWA